MPKYHTVFQNYTTLRIDRPLSRGKGGGLLIYIKTSLEFSEVNIAGPSTRMKVLGVTVRGYAIFKVYSPPSHHIQTDGFDFLSKFIKFVLCGPWCFGTNHNGRALLSIIEAHDLVVLNSSVLTHYSLSGRHEWSVIDLSIVSADIASRCVAAVVTEFIGSDHSIVQIAIRGADPRGEIEFTSSTFGAIVHSVRCKCILCRVQVSTMSGASSVAIQWRF